jgi:hypothetical protein
MGWTRKPCILAIAGWILLGILVSAPGAHAVEPQIPTSVDVYWKSTRTISVPGVTTVIILDDEIAQAQVGNDTIEFVGLSRGQTVALAYVNGNPVSIVVHIVEHPIKIVPPSLLQRELEMAHGSIGTDVQASTSPSGSSFLILDNMSWSQRIGDHQLYVMTQVEDNSQFGGNTTNLRSGAIAYSTPRMAVNLLDFSQSLSGESGEDHINNFSTPSSAGLRGVDVTMNRGKDQFSFFAGTTIPYYFLSLNATRDVAGFTFHRKQSEKLSLFGSTTYLNIPLSLPSGLQRHSYIQQTMGASYHLSKSLIIGAQGGYSNGGGMVRGDFSYSSYRLSGYGSALLVSQTYPLNQFQSLFSGTSGVKTGFSYRLTPRLTDGVYYEHTSISPGEIYRFSGSSDYFSPNLGFVIAHGETLNFSYTLSRSSGGFSSGSTVGNRYDVSLSSMLAAHLANTAEVTIGSIQDPLQINSEDQLTIRDSVSVPIKGQSLLLSFEHDSVQQSLISKLNQEISLLSPVLQAEFLANPQGFIDSANFPPEVKALLAAEQPVGTTFSAGTNLAIGSKLRLSPNVSITRATDGPQANSWTESFGYSLVYQVRPTFQLHSSLNNIFLLNSQQNSTVRTMLLTVGFQKSFTAAPSGLPFSRRSRIIEGRVFRDMNINGAYNTGEPGVAGVEVRLDDGQAVTTDSEGRYKFNSVSADQHHVSVDLTQFRMPVRMTTRNDASADLIQQHIVVANFGILDFARVIGSVFNDLRFDYHRQPDSKGLQSITLLLDDGKTVRKIETRGSGEYELDDVSPGDYKLSLDADSLPPNYTAPSDAIAVHVAPVSTIVQEFPVRALRSISGRVLLRVSNGPEKKVEMAQNAGSKVGPQSKGKRGNQQPPEAPPQQGESFSFLPLPDVQIKANDTVVSTDQNGNFLIRNLPAGKVAVSLVPVKPVPEGLKLPAGEVNLPADPIEVQGASIVISNPELVPYLTTKPLPNGPSVPPDHTAPILQGKAVPVPSPKSSREVTDLKQLPAVNGAAVVQPPAGQTKTVRAVTNPAVPVAPQTILLSELPLASLGGHLAQLPMVAPVAPVVQTASLDRTISRGNCSALTSLGETARCYAQLRNR